MISNYILDRFYFLSYVVPFLYQSQSSSFAKIFNTVSSKVNKLYSINASAIMHHDDSLSHAGGTDRSRELSTNFYIFGWL